MTLGRPRAHHRETTSTNDRARELAVAGAPHGTVVTAGVQTTGRGRQGRAWTAPAGSSVLLSLILRELDALLPLRAGLAVADVAGPDALVKWPNDVLLRGGKVAGILAEARPGDGWAVLGIGLNVALRLDRLPAELRSRAATLGRTPGDVPAVLRELLAALERRLGQPRTAVVTEIRARDALLDRPVAWAGGAGVGAGIDDSGALRVRLDDGSVAVLDAGEVHLQAVG
jgi:BirA family transcriptional regulator, biotin operon repressor / biotin---[acetyl-CoA-carboxylase] ligase